MLELLNKLSRLEIWPAAPGDWVTQSVFGCGTVASKLTELAINVSKVTEKHCREILAPMAQVTGSRAAGRRQSTKPPSAGRRQSRRMEEPAVPPPSLELLTLCDPPTDIVVSLVDAFAAAMPAGLRELRVVNSFVFPSK